MLGTEPKPVIVYLKVCKHEVPDVMSPVMQATRLRIVENSILLVIGYRSHSSATRNCGFFLSLPGVDVITMRSPGPTCPYSVPSDFQDRAAWISLGVSIAGLTRHKKIRAESSSNGSEIAECRVHSAKIPANACPE